MPAFPNEDAEEIQVVNTLPMNGDASPQQAPWHSPGMQSLPSYPNSPAMARLPTYLTLDGSLRTSMPGTPLSEHFGDDKTGFASKGDAKEAMETREKSDIAPWTQIPLRLESETSTQVEQAITKSTIPRYLHLDGLRGIAMLMVFTVHFRSLTFEAAHPEALEPGTPTAILAHPIGLCFFFMLSGYSNTASFLRKLYTNKDIRWQDLANAIVRRSLRLAIPTCVFSILQILQCHTNGFLPDVLAANILQTPNLGYPAWCAVTYGNRGSILHVSASFGRYVRSVLEVMTNNQPAYMLRNYSMLWSMYWQFWGMITVLALLPVIGIMRERAKWIVYALLACGLFFTYDLRLLFVTGMIIADLQVTKKFRYLLDKSRIIFIAIEVICAGVFLVLLCYNPAAVAMDRNIAKITIRSGQLGYDINEGPLQVRPSVYIMATLFFVWLEMSHALQWLVGVWPFRKIGQVAFGFYLSQISVLLWVIPPMVVHYTVKGKPYWTMIAYTYAASLTVNYVFGWIAERLLDKPALRFSTWFVRALQEHPTLAGFLAHSGRQIWHFCTSYLPNCIVNAPSTAKGKGENAVAFLHKLWNWRTPAPLVPAVPMSPECFGLDLEDLYSTEFSKDLVKDPQALRSRRLLKFWGWAWIGNFLLIPGLGVIWMMLNPWTDNVSNGFAAFGTAWRFLWLLALPYCLITHIGASLPDRERGLFESSKNERKVVRPTLHRLYIASVTRGSNEEATRRAHSILKKLEDYHPAVRVVVLTDEPYTYPDLQNVVCPKNYKSDEGKAKHKARALDYFRKTVNLNPYDWVLHMDEESTMDAECLRACFDFIRYTEDHIGQGIILYNAHQYWKNWFFTVADTIRAGDDLARFALQGKVFHRPVFGVHGSFLMLNGDVENNVGWDFASLAEDFEFSQSAWKKGYTLGRIHGIVREQSPTSVKDFLKQRRRWYMGIRDIKGLYLLPQLAIKLWTAGIFCLVATLVNILFSLLISQTGPTPRWIYVLSCYCFGNFYWLYFAGMLFQELDYGYPIHKWIMIPIHAIALILIQPIAAVVEACAILWAMGTETDKVGFEVIKK